MTQANPIEDERPHEFVVDGPPNSTICSYILDAEKSLYCGQPRDAAIHQVAGEPQKLGCAAHGFKFREGCDPCESGESLNLDPFADDPHKMTAEEANYPDNAPPDQHVAPPKLTVPISANNGVEVVVSGPLLVIRQPNFQQDAKVAVLTHAQAADIVKSLVAAHDIEYLAAAPIQAALDACATRAFTFSDAPNQLIVRKSDWEALVALVKGESNHV